MAEDKPLIERKPGTANDPEVFDVGRAFESGESGGTIVSDKKRTGVLGQLKNAAAEVAQNATKVVKDVKVFEEPEKPTVTPGTEREEVIKQAVRNAEQAPKDDHDVVIERIRTFQKDAERVSGKPYLITKNNEQKPSSWSHVLGDKPKEEEIKPAPKVTETIRRTPEPQMPKQMEQSVPQRKEVPVVPEPTPAPQTTAAPAQEPDTKPPVRTTPPQAVVSESKSRALRIAGMVGIGIVIAALVLGGGMYLYNFVTSQTDTSTPQNPIELSLDEYLLLEQLATFPMRLETQSTRLSQVVVVQNQGGTDPVTSQTFLTATAENVPNVLVRSLSDAMILGGVQAGSGIHPYLIFQTQSFDNAFAGMLAWEGTVGTDLNELFSRAQGPGFVDRIIDNQHVRILYDVTGVERLVYGFVNSRILIITATSDAFQTVVSGL